MKKLITLLFLLEISMSTVFAGKLVSKEPSPLSVIESNEERLSWCEKDGYAFVKSSGNLHYWLYDSYKHHNGDVSDFIFNIVPKWFQSMEYFVYSDYETFSPNNNLADSVKKLMSDSKSDVSITFVQTGNNGSAHICINSYDNDSDTYSTYIFYGTKTDSGKITSVNKENTSLKKTDSNKNHDFEKLYEVVLADIVTALNNKKSKVGDKFYENIEKTKKSVKTNRKTTDLFGNTSSNDNLPDTAYEYLLLRLDALRKEGHITKYGIASIKHGCLANYNVPTNFKIAIGMSEASLAKLINSLPYKGL